MKTNKKAIGSFLAVVMLLVVSFVSASAYTVRPTQMTTEPASLGILGEATLNIHAEVAVYADDPPDPLKGGDVRAVLLFTPFWFRFISPTRGITDSNGYCQLCVSALPEWLDIPLYYRVWITDPESGQTTFGGTGGIYAGKTYNMDFLVVCKPPSPINNVAEQKILQSLYNR